MTSECPCVEEVEEVCHDKNGKQQCEFVSADMSFIAELQLQKVCQRGDVGMLESKEHGEQQ